MSQSRNATARSRVGQSLFATSVFLRKQLWIWPILAALMLTVVGLTIRGVVEREVKSNLAAQLETILTADVTALEIWLNSQQRDAEAISADTRVRGLITSLAGRAAQPEVEAAELLANESQQGLRDALRPWLLANEYEGFAVVDKDGLFLSSDRDELVGRNDLPLPEKWFDGVFAGQATVIRPSASSILLPTEDGTMRAGVPTMFAVAPVRDDNDQVIAALGFRIQPDKHFTRILTVARAGESGETYAFDQTGLLISQSRFDEQLKQIGLLPDNDKTRSILNIQIRDPGVNMWEGRRPQLRRSQQPLTRMAADAVKGHSGVDVDGYNDYRGVPVVGAWTWLPSYEFGVATEVDVAEAYRPLYVLRIAFWGLFVLLAVGAVAIFVFTLIVSRLNRTAMAAAIIAKKLGQYTLDEKIGEGGMGVVYRGHHAMLQRPTAIKLLPAEKSSESAIARFEREVRLTARLNHPNTISIYDYGRTPEGVFYYAMEYLEGVNLDDLVAQAGAQPEGRVIHILRQICGSLAEAHSAGLIHRDIKPANIILGQCGGLYDFSKVLDFGLVKAVDSKAQRALTIDGTLTGTPLYLSPEGIGNSDQVDARSDLYAVAAVGYYLLSGEPLFDSPNITKVCMQQVHEMPKTPSERLGRQVDVDLERILMRCLAKDPAERYQTARELETALAGCASQVSWTQIDAEQWWQHFKSHETPPSRPTAKLGPAETMPPDASTSETHLR